MGCLYLLACRVSSCGHEVGRNWRHLSGCQLDLGAPWWRPESEKILKVIENCCLRNVSAINAIMVHTLAP